MAAPADKKSDVRTRRVTGCKDSRAKADVRAFMIDFHRSRDGRVWSGRRPSEDEQVPSHRSRLHRVPRGAPAMPLPVSWCSPRQRWAAATAAPSIPWRARAAATKPALCRFLCVQEFSRSVPFLRFDLFSPSIEADATDPQQASNSYSLTIPINPPSTGSTVPFTYFDSSDAKNKLAWAMSHTSPCFPVGDMASRFFHMPSSSPP